MPKGKGPGLEDLRQRKKELIIESDINRQILRIEVCQLRLKAMEWRRGVLTARATYKWIAPLAGMGFAFFSMRKKLHAHASKHNGHGHRKSAYLNLLAPLGMAAVRKAYSFWRHARKRNASA